MVDFRNFENGWLIEFITKKKKELSFTKKKKRIEKCKEKINKYETRYLVAMCTKTDWERAPSTDAPTTSTW